MKQVVGDADRGDNCPDAEVCRDLVRYERVFQPPPKLGRWAAELDGLLAGNAAKAAREQLTLIRIFEELRGRGYDGGYQSCAARSP
jgi:hypothetical protein